MNDYDHDHDEDDTLLQMAYHKAGHALMCHHLGYQLRAVAGRCFHSYPYPLSGAHYSSESNPRRTRFRSATRVVIACS